jgi:uncharacterized membrane protein
MFVCGRLAGGTNRTGWIAATLVTISPMSIYYSREGRPYALFMLLSAALCLAILAAYRRNSAFTWWAYGGLLSLCGLTHLLTVQLVAVFGVFSLAYAISLDSAPQRWSRLVRLSWVTALGLLVGSAWGVFRFVESAGSAIAMGQAVTGTHYQHGVANYLRTLLVNFGAGPVKSVTGDLTGADGLAAVFFILFALGLRWIYRARQADLLLFVGLLFPIPLVITFVNVGIASNWDWARYASHLLLPFLLIVGLGLESATSLLRTRFRQNVALAILAVAFLPATLRLQVREEYRQYRDMSAYLERNADDLTGVIVLPVAHETGRADERIMNIYDRQKRDTLPMYALSFGVVHDVRRVPGRVGEFAQESNAPGDLPASGRYALLWRRPLSTCDTVSMLVASGSVSASDPAPGAQAPNGITVCQLEVTR